MERESLPTSVKGHLRAWPTPKSSSCQTTFFKCTPSADFKAFSFQVSALQLFFVLFCWFLLFF